jgi:acyl-ACP thioesterase
VWVIAKEEASWALERMQNEIVRAFQLQRQIESRKLAPEYVAQMAQRYFSVIAPGESASIATQFWKALTAPAEVRIQVAEELLQKAAADRKRGGRKS